MPSVKTFKVSLCKRSEIRDFIEKWHYSKNINGLQSDYCFKLEDGEKLIGAMIYGKIAMRNVWKKYAEKESDLIELRRLCCIDDTPKNTESYFIGKTLRWLKQNTDIKRIVSYADNEFGHGGVIYQATNFKKVGETTKGRIIMFNSKRYHDKTIRTKYNGKLKPYAQRIKNALDVGEATYQTTKTKNVFIKELY